MTGQLTIRRGTQKLKRVRTISECYFIFCGIVFSFGLEIKRHLVWVAPIAEPGVTPLDLPHPAGTFVLKRNTQLFLYQKQVRDKIQKSCRRFYLYYFS